MTDREFAKEYALHTNEVLFLTGRAGTGKTTLLKEILAETDKKSVVVAPTGVAAINSGGMTIHSFFQLPPTGFIPSDEPCDPHIFTNRRTLAKNQKFRRDRIQLIIELEFLIIDEISMVRADLLDAIDITLKRVRKNQLPFGGVQVMVIGDLFQLSPVVRRENFRVLSNYYASPYFFDSLVWQKINPITIELQEIFRQADNFFINILNNIRIGTRNEKDIESLNSRLVAEFPDNVITLTTHNSKAQSINQTKLKNLQSRSFELEATVTGKFSPASYPVKEKIILKTGCQVMFIRNHPDGLYFNGKIGTVTEIKEDILYVSCPGDPINIPVEPTEWKNIQYSVDKESKEIYKKEIGNFRQYPLKLAWAVTVHKSQGLTFEKLILDVSETFAPGQLYVALSRAKSLEGLYLQSPVRLDNIIVDPRISTYYAESIAALTSQDLAASKAKYYDIKIRKHWSFLPIISQLEYWEELVEESGFPEEEQMLSLIKELKDKLNELESTGQLFIKQITELTNDYLTNDQKLKVIIERCHKAIFYFGAQLHDQIILPIEEHYKEWRLKAKVKKYIKFLELLQDDVWYKLNSLFKINYRTIPIHAGASPYTRTRFFDPDKSIRKKGATYEITLELLDAGKSLEEIANVRSLALGTIEGHINRLLKQGKLEIESVMSNDRYESLVKYFPDDGDISISEIKAKAPDDATFGELRWIKTHLSLLDGQKK